MIKLYKTEVKYGGYNLSPTGGTYKGCHSEESIQRMKDVINTPEKKAKRSKSQLGHKSYTKGKHWNLSEDTKKTMSKIRKGRPAWNKGLNKDTDERVKTSSHSHKKYTFIKRKPKQIALSFIN